METRGFGHAARVLGISQSTVSQHVARLERAIGRPLLLRDTHRVIPTADGETLLAFAREILDAEARATAWLADTARRERLRFGVSEDLVLERLPPVLRDFTRDHPQIDLDLMVGLSGPLSDALDGGALDLVFAKAPARPGGELDDRERLVWRDKPVWVASPYASLDADEVVPLITYADLRSITRDLAVRALDGAGRRWRLACTSGSLSGLLAAAEAGLGVTLQARQVLRPGLAEAPRSARLPPVPTLDFVVFGRAARLHGPAALLADAIVGSVARLRT